MQKKETNITKKKYSTRRLTLRQQAQPRKVNDNMGCYNGIAFPARTGANCQKLDI